MDLFITIAGILWVVLHFSFPLTSDERGDDDDQKKRENNRGIIDSIGYGVIILRFCTITGKHVRLVKCCHGSVFCNCIYDGQSKGSRTGLIIHRIYYASRLMIVPVKVLPSYIHPLIYLHVL